MQYEIFGSTLPGVTLTFQSGESIYTQSGGMTWMSDGIRMETNMKGGFGKALGRLFTGESIFMASYTAERSGAQMTLASSFPGSIVVLELDGTREYICQKDGFLCATPGVKLSASVQKANTNFLRSS